MKLLFYRSLCSTVFILCSFSAFSFTDSTTKEKHTIYGGFRFQKSAGFYWINGISAELKTTKIWNQKISFGFNFLSSKLGTAINSNAIPYFETNMSAIYYFRNQKQLQPLVRLNTGYAHANYGSDEFNEIPNQSLLLSLETGITYNFKIPVKLAISGGYNIITGNGIKGMGVLYPLYAQFSAFYKFSFY